jgi:hypothetical protein
MFENSFITCDLQQPVSESALSMINMGNNAEVPTRSVYKQLCECLPNELWVKGLKQFLIYLTSTYEFKKCLPEHLALEFDKTPCS